MDRCIKIAGYETFPGLAEIGTMFTSHPLPCRSSSVTLKHTYPEISRLECWKELFNTTLLKSGMALYSYSGGSVDWGGLSQFMSPSY